MTPYDLKLLLHIYVTPINFEHAGTEHYEGVIQDFLMRGIIKQETEFSYHNEHGYALTEKGKAWLEMILSTPVPVNRWIDPRDEKNLSHNE